MTRALLRRYPVTPLVACVHNLSTDRGAELLGVTRSTMQRWARTPTPMIVEWEADKYAVRLGKHPGELWDNWFDISSPIKPNRVIKRR